MNNLLESRRSALGPQSPIKLQNLSPQKYGKGAYVDITYTPSKLVDNVLYRDVTTLKKMEEGNGKRRQSQAMNTLFQDRLNQLKEERDGIEMSLTSQITMYKKLLQESEIKYEAHIKETHTSFKEQINQLITDKEQEAKYAQGQKQILENRIEELERQLEGLKDKLNNTGGQLQNLKNQKEKLDIKYQNVCQKLEEIQAQMQQQKEQAQQQYEQLSKKHYAAEAAWEQKSRAEIDRHLREEQRLNILHKNELQKLENQRQIDNCLKNQEIKDIQALFDAEANRLAKIIYNKDMALDALQEDLSHEKNRGLQFTKSYQKQINLLSHDNSKHLQDIREYRNENEYLVEEVKNLRGLLMESSIQLEKCKQQFVRLSRQRDRLIFQVRELGGENRALHRINDDKQLEANTWRESYYQNKHLF